MTSASPQCAPSVGYSYCINRTGLMTTQLQSVGTVNAKPAGQLQPGDVTIWNFGYKWEVVGFTKETAAQVVVEMINNEGKTWQKRMGKTRLVGLA